MPRKKTCTLEELRDGLEVRLTTLEIGSRSLEAKMTELKEQVTRIEENDLAHLHDRLDGVKNYILGVAGAMIAALISIWLN